jgi:hypothetical protein
MLTNTDDSTMRLWELPQGWDYTSKEMYVMYADAP